MPWTPKLAAVDVRSIVTNLVAFFEENQADALAWASPDRALESLTLYPTAQSAMEKDFPHMGVVGRESTLEDDDAGKKVTYALTLEFEIATSYRDNAAERTAAVTQLMKDVDATAYAFESMALNIPTTTLYGEGVHEIFRTVTNAGRVIEAASGPTNSMFNTQLRLLLQFRVPLYN